MSFKVVSVRWLDACYVGAEWKKPDELSSKGDHFEVVSSGLLVAEDGRGIYLATDYDPDGKRHRHISFVPHAMIVKRKVVKVDV